MKLTARWLSVLQLFALFSLLGFVSPLMMLLMPLSWLKFFCPLVLFVFHNMTKQWQMLMVVSLLSQMMWRKGEERNHFSDDVENLREVVRSIMTFCGERLESLAELWILLTAYRCLKDQVEETHTLPSQKEITSTLESNPISGAAGTAELGTFEQLGLCPYRVPLCDDMRGAVKFAQGLDSLSPEFEQVLLFLRDAHAFLHILIRMEMNGLSSARCIFGVGRMPNAR